MSSLYKNVKHQLRQNITSPRAYFMMLGISVAAALGYGIYTGNNTILVAVSGLMASLSVFLVYTSMKATYEWNRRKTTAEIIDKLMTGEFSKKLPNYNKLFPSMFLIEAKPTILLYRQFQITNEPRKRSSWIFLWQKY